MPNTSLEEKRRFFALYYGQKVKPAADGSLRRLEAFHLDYITHSDYIVLKINDTVTTTRFRRRADYWREKGFCCGWKSYTEPELLKFGWVKLVHDDVYPPIFQTQAATL